VYWVLFRTWPSDELTTYVADADAVLGLEGVDYGGAQEISKELAFNYSFAGGLVSIAIDP
jgi:hypothetical protein